MIGLDHPYHYTHAHHGGEDSRRNFVEFLGCVSRVKLDRKPRDSWRDQQVVVSIHQELRTPLAGFPFPLTRFAHKIVHKEKEDAYQVVPDLTATEQLNEPGQRESAMVRCSFERRRLVGDELRSRPIYLLVLILLLVKRSHYVFTCRYFWIHRPPTVRWKPCDVLRRELRSTIKRPCPTRRGTAAMEPTLSVNGYTSPKEYSRSIHVQELRKVEGLQ